MATWVREVAKVDTTTGAIGDQDVTVGVPGTHTDVDTVATGPLAASNATWTSEGKSANTCFTKRTFQRRLGLLFF